MSVLADELTNDPLGRGYSGMTDQQAADDLNTVYRTRNRTSMEATTIYNAIDQTEWAALSAAEQTEIWDIVHMGTVNPFGREADRFIAIFPGGGPTLTALADARTEDISRAVELGLGVVNAGDVQKARAE